MRSRSVVVGDIHFSAHTPRGVERDLISLLRDHAGARFIFAGDFLDLSADVPRVAPERAIAVGFGARPLLARALAEHVDGGGSLAFIAGNHDPELGAPGAASQIAQALGLGSDARDRVTASPWFFRDGALHVEHGHLFDPDNAPVHPLAVPRASLGVHFVEQFIAPTGAYDYLNSNDGTPLRLFVNAFRWYRARAPYVVARYFYAAATALARSGPFFDGADEQRRGEAALEEFLEGSGVTRDMALAMARRSAAPTMASFRDTVARLYIDRVASTLGLLAGATALGLGGPLLGATLAGAGALALAMSWLGGHDRYGGSVAERLRQGALGIADATAATVVILGHAHRAEQDGPYANTGSFAFPRELAGRPLLIVDGGEALSVTRVLHPIARDG